MTAAQSSPKRQLTLRDFFDTTKPWDLREFVSDPEALRKAFSFVPDRFKEGDWRPFTSWVLFSLVGLVLYATIDANLRYSASQNKTIIEEFVGEELYPAFTVEWYYNVSLFLLMNYVSKSIVTLTSNFGPWVSFTMCSWTIMTIRHGICAVAPFIPSVRIMAGMLRFPVLLSSSITFGIWNFLLMPVISLGFLKGEKRIKFIRWAFTWRLCQIHVFNIMYAYLNCVWAEPKAQPLHLGDINAGVIYIIVYLLFYYLILDRIGIQLYPIFSPRTYICIPSWLLTGGICAGTYRLWNFILSAGA